MGLEELKKEIKRLNSLKENREHCTIDSQLKTIKMVVGAIEGLCIKESDGLEVYENRHDEGKGDGIWINCLDLIEIKQLLNIDNSEITDKGLKEIKEKSDYLKKCSEDEDFREREVQRMIKENTPSSKEAKKQ